jgi:hypothetical protein
VDATLVAVSNLTSDWNGRKARIIADANRTLEPDRMGFIRALEGNALRLGNALPNLTLAQVEALCELSSAYLSVMRRREAAFVRGTR